MAPARPAGAAARLRGGMHGGTWHVELAHGQVGLRSDRRLRIPLALRGLHGLGRCARGVLPHPESAPERAPSREHAEPSAVAGPGDTELAVPFPSRDEAVAGSDDPGTRGVVIAPQRRAA